MDLLTAILLGVVQGLTEFLPISSTAHIRILPALLGQPDPGAAFTAAIQLGTLLAVLIYFRHDLGRALVGWVKGLRGGEAGRTPEARMGWAILIGTFPILIGGVLFKDQIETQLRSLQIIAWMLIGMGLLMWVAERVGKGQRDVEQVTWKDGLWVGLWQAIALIPGASRSGSTMTGAMFFGFDRGSAARFSFLLSVPSILAAGVYSMHQHWTVFTGPLALPTIVANVVSFFTGYAAIAFLLNFLRTRTLGVFVIYRIALGILILALIQTGTLSPDQGLPTEPAPASSSR